MRLVFWSGFWVFLADQASKYLVVHWMNLRQLGEITVLPPFLNFHMAWNQGINFGYFSGHSDVTRWILVAVALAVISFVLIWVRRSPVGTLAFFSAGILIGGALGNVVDRLLYGAVADFINMSCCGINNPYAFNIADVAVFAGAIGLVVFGNDKNVA